MILSDFDIVNEMAKGNIKISPFNQKLQLQPASVDITLASSFTVPFPDTWKIDFESPIHYKTFQCDTFVLRPHSFVLAATKEFIEIGNNITAQVEGRSSVGRLGLFIQNAGWVDPGFRGTITLELYNASDVPIVLNPGMRIGQLVFSELRNRCMNPYKGKYNGQVEATGSRIYLDEERSKKDE